jgi:hypothetical protein
VDDLERLFQILVEVLEKESPERVRTPFQVSELYQNILPYRSYKNRLGFDTNQDYEMAVLRLLAGEGNYVIVEPEEVREQLAEEAQSINPTPGTFREYAAARVLLNPGAVRSAKSVSEAYAPPPAEPEPVEEQAGHSRAPPLTPPAPIRPPVFEAVDAAAERAAKEPEVGKTIEEHVDSEVVEETDAPLVPDAPAAVTSCPQCGEGLPSTDVVFCPFCGARIGTTECSACGAAVDPGWRFCAKCGMPDRSA